MISQPDHKQSFLNALDSRARRLVESQRDVRSVALGFAGFTRPLSPSQAINVAIRLFYLSVLMPTIAAAELTAGWNSEDWYEQRTFEARRRKDDPEPRRWTARVLRDPKEILNEFNITNARGDTAPFGHIG